MCDVMCVISFNCITETITIIPTLLFMKILTNLCLGMLALYYVLRTFAAFQRLSIHYKSFNLFLNVFQSEV